MGTAHIFVLSDGGTSGWNAARASGGITSRESSMSEMSVFARSGFALQGSADCDIFVPA
jgi:hypothetical protein